MMLSSIVWDVDPTIFEIGSRQIRWYGLMWGLGFILAYKYAEWLFKREKYPEEWVDKLFVYALISVGADRWRSSHRCGWAGKDR